MYVELASYLFLVLSFVDCKLLLKMHICSNCKSWCPNCYSGLMNFDGPPHNYYSKQQNGLQTDALLTVLYSR